MDKNGVVILGVFVADLAFRAGKMPAIGETIAGSGFAVGPGGKGSNQAVAAARAGSGVTFISRIGSCRNFGNAAWHRSGYAAPRGDRNAVEGAIAVLKVMLMKKQEHDQHPRQFRSSLVES